MLVIASDFHLTDGTSGETVRDGAFRLFRQRLRDMAYDSSKRVSETYEPIKEVDVILLGDILDVIRSTKWLSHDAGEVRPWSELKPGKRKHFEKKVEEITDAILKKNKKSLDILKGMSRGRKMLDAITLPPAKGGEVDPEVGWHPDDPKRVRVQVRFHYMVGNHDWFYYLPGKSVNLIRSKIVRAMGLENDSTKPFPHDPEESVGISELLADHQVFARHGDVYDPLNYIEHLGRGASSIGDVIVIELLNRFPQEVSKLGSRTPQLVHDGLREIDNVRPLPLIPVWIDGLLRRSGANQAQRTEVKAVWDRLADRFLKIAFVKRQDTWGWDAIDWLQMGLKFSQGVTLKKAAKIVDMLRVKMPPSAAYQDAISERDFKNQRARFIVYGHTHRHEIVPLDVSQPRYAQEFQRCTSIQVPGGVYTAWP